ncbi:MAG: pyrimidine dimer DNA glycosylase/endonuclease V [Clostridia bacterium]
MNIFLPYENDIDKSVQSLDNLRLNKQILEVKTIISAINAYNADGAVKGYYNHPVTQFYKDNVNFLAHYGIACCKEYLYRNDKEHSLNDYFIPFATSKCKFVPFYMEGSKGNGNYVRTTENVGELFQKKLFNKWLNDKKEPSWGKREMPEFWIKEINIFENYQKLLTRICNMV